MKIKCLLNSVLLLFPFFLFGQKTFLSLSSGQYFPIGDHEGDVKKVMGYPYSRGNVTRFEVLQISTKRIAIGAAYQRLAMNNWEERVQKYLTQTYPDEYYRTVYPQNTAFLKNAHQISFFAGRSMPIGRLDLVPCAELGLVVTPLKLASADIKAIGSHELTTWETSIQRRRVVHPFWGIKTKFYYPIWRKLSLAAQVGISGMYYRQTFLTRTTKQISGEVQSESLTGRGMVMLADGQIGLALKMDW